MITEQDLNQAIVECENSPNPNANTCMKLASYYVIKDKMYPQEETVTYSRSAGIDIRSDTEFARIVRNLNPDDVMEIMDELMTTVELISPKLYNAIINKLESLL